MTGPLTRLEGRPGARSWGPLPAPPRPESVRIGEYLIRRRDEAPHGLAIRGLGSCIALFLYSQEADLGGLAHILLPEPLEGSPLTSPGKFAPTALAAMIDRMQELGCPRAGLEAKIAGGARMFASVPAERESLGQRNIRAALAALQKERIPLRGQDTGGTGGRSILVDLATRTVRVTSLRSDPREI